MIGLAKKKTIMPSKQAMNPRWNDRLFSSPPNAVSNAIITIPIAKMVIPKALNSVNTVSNKLFNELNNFFHHLSKLNF